MSSLASILLHKGFFKWRTTFNFQLRTFYTKSPSNEPGFLLFDQISQSQLYLPNSTSTSIIEKHTFISKTNSVLRVPNQEIPNVKSCLLAHEFRPNLHSSALQFPSLSPSYRSKLLKDSLQKAILQAISAPISTAGNVLKHRKRKMNKHKYKKRMREQRLKAPKNQLFKPYVIKHKE